MKRRVSSVVILRIFFPHLIAFSLAEFTESVPEPVSACIWVPCGSALIGYWHLPYWDLRKPPLPSPAPYLLYLCCVLCSKSYIKHSTRTVFYHLRCNIYFSNLILTKDNELVLHTVKMAQSGFSIAKDLDSCVTFPDIAISLSSLPLFLLSLSLSLFSVNSHVLTFHLLWSLCALSVRLLWTPV